MPSSWSAKPAARYRFKPRKSLRESERGERNSIIAINNPKEPQERSIRNPVFWIVLIGFGFSLLGVVLAFVGFIQLLASVSNLLSGALNAAVTAGIGVGLYIVGNYMLRGAAGYKKQKFSASFVFDVLLNRLSDEQSSKEE
jgi:hypothetical protein